jgi:phospholipid-binding lipoprotein MlaA
MAMPAQVPKSDICMKNTINFIAARADYMPARGLFGMLFLTASLLLTGCATGPNANPRDPFEPFNRVMFSFNDGVDTVVAKPAAQVYKAVTPTFVRKSVDNFFGNLGDLWSTVNSLLQFKGAHAAENFMRFSVNSVLGIGGLFDIATEAGLERHIEDFGQTLGHWGVPPGPYLVLPLLGPSTVRDTAAKPVDIKGNLVNYVDQEGARYAANALSLVETRARLLDAEKLLDDVVIDKYSFTRDFYLQRRRNAVFDGAPPPEYEDEEKSDSKPEAKPDSKPTSKLETEPAAAFAAQNATSAPNLVTDYGAVTTLAATSATTPEPASAPAAAASAAVPAELAASATVPATTPAQSPASLPVITPPRLPAELKPQ